MNKRRCKTIRMLAQACQAVAIPYPKNVIAPRYMKLAQGSGRERWVTVMEYPMMVNHYRRLKRAILRGEGSNTYLRQFAPQLFTATQPAQ